MTVTTTTTATTTTTLLPLLPPGGSPPHVSATRRGPQFDGGGDGVATGSQSLVENPVETKVLPRGRRDRVENQTGRTTRRTTGTRKTMEIEKQDVENPARNGQG